MRVNELRANRVVTEKLENADRTLSLSLTELKNLDSMAAALSSTEWGFINSVVAGTVAASKVVAVDANKDVGTFRNVTLTKGILGTATNGFMLGAGASGANHALGTTAGNAVEFYLNATHTTGDMRGQYTRLYFSGAGGSGEAQRIFSTINNVSVAAGGTVNGAHISIGTAGANAAVSGAANALRCTFGIAAASTNIGGTCAVIQCETDMDTAVTVPTNMSFIRFNNLGVKKANALFNVPAPAAETNGLFCAHVTDAMTHSLRVVDASGAEYHIMCTTTATNRTES